MFSHQYKGLYIQGYFDKPECTVVLPSGGIWVRTKSYLAAKQAITKYLAGRKWGVTNT